MSWDFRVGQRVVCVNDDGYMYVARPKWLFWSEEKNFRHNLERGREYSISWTGVVTFREDGPILCVAVSGGQWIGAEFGPDRCQHPHPFPAHWFRPLVTRKTSIEVFDKILKGEPVAEAFDPQTISGKLHPHAHEAACSTDRTPS